MKHAWSFLWLVVASCIALSIISQMIKPYLGVIALIFLLSLTGIIVYRVIKHRRSGKRHF